MMLWYEEHGASYFFHSFISFRSFLGIKAWKVKYKDKVYNSIALQQSA